VVSFGARLQGSLRKTGQLLLLQLFHALVFRPELSLLDVDQASCHSPQRAHGVNAAGDGPYWIRGICSS